VSNAGGLPAHDVRCDLAVKALRLSGRLRLQVSGGSMLPSVWPGDILLIHLAEFSGLRTGDLLFYARNGGFVVHRVVGKNVDAVITRGDALAQDDDPVAPSRVLGKVAVIERGRARFVPKEKLTSAQRLLRSLICRYDGFRVLLLRLNALRLRFNRPQAEPRNLQI
jgi:hypothetical protein